MLVRLEVRLRWWLRAYLWSLALTCTFTGMAPNAARVEAWIKRGLVIRAFEVQAVLVA